MSRQSLTPLNALSSASAPTVPTLQSGDLYYDTTTGLRVYNGSAWVAVSSSGSVDFSNDQNILANQVFG
jgi:hypothetical protein